MFDVPPLEVVPLSRCKMSDTTFQAHFEPNRESAVTSSQLFFRLNRKCTKSNFCCGSVHCWAIENRLQSLKTFFFGERMGGGIGTTAQCDLFNFYLLTTRLHDTVRFLRFCCTFVVVVTVFSANLYFSYSVLSYPTFCTIRS